MPEEWPDQLESLPLFPLPVVLFPRARTRLRIFEQRYLDMTRDCAASGSGFGIVHVQPASDGRPARHAAIGTEAVIEDFTTLEDGLLGIDVRGRRRFRVHTTGARDTGLIIGQVEWIPSEPKLPVAPEFAVLQAILRELMHNKALAEEIDSGTDRDDASILGMTLASVLPIPSEQAQELLAVSDPEERLRGLLQLLANNDNDDNDDNDDEDE